MKILVVGGANGIGKSAVTYLKRNNTIIVVDKDKEALNNLEAVETIHIDITNEKEVHKRLSTLDIDILVNCAGVQKQGAVEDMKITEFEEHIYHNYIGHINTIKASLPSLRENKGKIINISSIAGKIGLPLSSGYCASKYAVEGFSDALRRELDDIDIILVEPGRVKTGFNEGGRDHLENYSNSNYQTLYNQKLGEDVKGIDPKKAGSKLAWIILNGSNPRYTITREAYWIAKLKKFIPDRLVDLIFIKYRA